MDRPRETPNRRRWYGLGLATIAGALLLGTAFVGLEPAAPDVDLRTVLVDAAERGRLVIEVRGPGTLVPEQIRWITALTAGRIEQRRVDPGETVAADSVILELSNPDVELEALDAQRQLTAAQAGLLELRTRLEHERLDQVGALANVRAEHQAATRRAGAVDRLLAEHIISDFEASERREHAEEMQARYRAESERLELVESTVRQKIVLQETQVERLREIHEFQRERVDSMRVRAGAAGVLQHSDLEVGQWVQPGTLLAKVAEPGKLKAILRIPETLAKDITIGQPASIDTRNGELPGRVFRIDPAVQNGNVEVHVRLEGALPRGARPDLSVEGTIEVGRLEDVVHVDRPAYSQAHSTLGLFVLAADGRSASRQNVRLGRASSGAIEIVDGLAAGDRIIVSDMSRWDTFDRVVLH
jgi:multidrug efflux pump subunit AcrA (membrane-fusion protein)